MLVCAVQATGLTGHKPRTLCVYKCQELVVDFSIDLVLCSKPGTDKTSLVVQWLRIYLPMHGTQVQSLVWDDSTCSRATRPMSHNY